MKFQNFPTQFIRVNLKQSQSILLCKDNIYVIQRWIFSLDVSLIRWGKVIKFQTWKELKWKEAAQGNLVTVNRSASIGSMWVSGFECSQYSIFNVQCSWMVSFNAFGIQSRTCGKFISFCDICFRFEFISSTFTNIYIIVDEYNTMFD